MVAAEKTRDKEAPKSLMAAKVREKEPNSPYRQALAKLAEGAKGDYYVCSACGSTTAGERPGRCSQCRSEAINHVKIG